MMEPKIHDQLTLLSVVVKFTQGHPVDRGDFFEIVELARLGLWAKKYGIPGLEKYSGETLYKWPDDWRCAKMGGPPNIEDCVQIDDHAHEALSALASLNPS